VQPILVQLARCYLHVLCLVFTTLAFRFALPEGSSVCIPPARADAAERAHATHGRRAEGGVHTNCRPSHHM
jgi:hypothetical protein